VKWFPDQKSKTQWSLNQAERIVRTHNTLGTRIRNALSTITGWKPETIFDRKRNAKRANAANRLIRMFNDQALVIEVLLEVLKYYEERTWWLGDTVETRQARIIRTCANMIDAIDYYEERPEEQVAWLRTMGRMTAAQALSVRLYEYGELKPKRGRR
jgi:hypothetical protein